MDRLRSRLFTITAALFALLAICTTASPQNASGSGHGDGMNERGEQVMGFSQTKTTHHFFLLRDGGVIQVRTNDPSDTTSRDEIRKHLAHTVEMFS